MTRTFGAMPEMPYSSCLAAMMPPMAAVLARVADVPVSVQGVPSVHVVDEAVAVVVDVVAGDLAPVHPEISVEVVDVGSYPGVHDGHHHRRVSPGDGPGPRGVHVRPGGEVHGRESAEP
jgi:hypothetical protein